MLRPDTERLWHFLREQPALGGFLLIGGSALALHLRHRLSEDLDFVSLEAKLPHARLGALLRAASQAGFNFQPNTDPTAAEEFLNAGLELADYQQDFLVDGGVKVTFFAADAPLKAVLSPANSAAPRVAALDELFRAKSLLTAARARTRDWFDLYVLLRDHGFTLADYHAAFVRAGIPQQFDLGLNRLCSGVPAKADEGFEQLLADAPTPTAMRDFFRQLRDHYECQAARATAQTPRP